MNLLQINVTANWGSHGKIAEAIGRLALEEGWNSMIAYGRGTPCSHSSLIRIGNDFDMTIHGIGTRFFDLNGLLSKNVTKRFIEEISSYKPDIIHLHNIHGYYLNYPILFNWIKKINVPVIWTLHDCWPWTGHCAYYTYERCNKWENFCHNCPGLNNYPVSYWDRTKRNFTQKKKSFLNVPNMTLVPVSNWLNDNVKKSFLGGYKSKIIHNGIDLEQFHPIESKEKIRNKFNLKNKILLLGVASNWEKRKGLEEFIKLRKLLSYDYQIILVGLSKSQISGLPEGIIGISRTNNIEELVELYSAADIYLNPTLEDNFPTTNLEALACGTPIITYNTGGSPEAVNKDTGLVVEYKDIKAFAAGIFKIKDNNMLSSELCRERAVRLFDANKVFYKYIDLYKEVLN